MNKKRSTALSVGMLILWFISSPAHSQTRPTVVSTDPPNGAAGVSAWLASFSMTFSKPMDTTRCGASTRNWPYGPGGSCTWSADKLTMTLTRYNPQTPFGPGQKIEAYLVDPEWNPPVSYLVDAEGNHLDPYHYSFTISTAPVRNPAFVNVPADPQKGFSWSYYLYTPASIKKPAVLMVETNNTGVSDDPAVHDQGAYDLIAFKSTWADMLGVPYLVPVFPRPASDPTMYTHALDRKTILTTTPGLVRIDLQLIKMVEDARARLAAAGISVDARFFMVGFSAAGSFTSRFVILHPEVVKAASIGAPGFGPIVPVAKWNGQDLPYPEGTADLKDLVGVPFALDAFRTVPLQVYVGDEDVNTDPWWNLTNPEVALISAAFGGVSLYQRWQEYEAAYNSVSSSSQFVVFPGMGHTYSTLWEYLTEFFERNRAEPYPPPLPKPLLYSLYFPHVASFDVWETEIALTSTSIVPVHGELQAMKAEGGDPTEAVPITIPAGGRVELKVGKSFQRPQDVAYLRLLSDSALLTGYTRFYQPGNRASLALGLGSRKGWFTKIEKDGWTGIAFVNVDTVAASVTLTAWDDNGNQVASTTLSLAPGQKSVGMVDQLFKTDVRNATYCRYSSEKNLLGFTVSGSSDGQMLDGLHALGEYISAKR